MRDRLDADEFRRLRITAAHLAIKTLAISAPARPAMGDAVAWQDFWLARITAPMATVLKWSATVTDQHGHTKSQISSTGGTMATAITMDDTLTVAAQTEDDHGDPTPDTLSWSGSDGGAVLTLTPSDDTLSLLVTPVAEGAATITVTDQSATGITGTLDVTVGPGATSQIVLTPTVNTGANPAPAGG